MDSFPPAMALGCTQGYMIKKKKKKLIALAPELLINCLVYYCFMSNDYVIVLHALSRYLPLRFDKSSLFSIII